MPAVSSTPTAVSTTAKTPVHLESIETANFGTGDLGYVTDVERYYKLDKSSSLHRDGINVLYTRNSNPRYNGGRTSPGRWILQVPSGIGPTGPTGPMGPAGPDLSFAYAEVEGPAVLTTLRPTYTDLLTTTIEGPGTFSIRASVSVNFPTTSMDGGAGNAFFRVLIDGVPDPQQFAVTSGIFGPGTLVPASGGLEVVRALGPGTHVFTLQWALNELIAPAFNVTAEIAPGDPNGMHGTLTIEQLAR